MDVTDVSRSDGCQGSFQECWMSRMSSRVTDVKNGGCLDVKSGGCLGSLQVWWISRSLQVWWMYKKSSGVVDV